MTTQPRTEIDSQKSQTSQVTECLDRLSAEKTRKLPVSTYRFQFNKDFRFVDAQRLVPYLQGLGVSTCYASPILRARDGSAHGYDIVDHGQINPEIGTEEELYALSAALKERGMGLLLDVVPNHMGVGHGTNSWWQDVLQNGRSSKYANFFDIDWEPIRTELRNKILLPILGNQYGTELEDGRLKLVLRDGDFIVEYYDKRLPVDPQTIPLIFHDLGQVDSSDPEIRDLLGVLVSLSELPKHSVTDVDAVPRRQRELPFLKQRFVELLQRSPHVQKLVDEAVNQINGTPGNPRSFDSLHQLLEAQSYRAAHWRVSSEEINYRRFFDINDLAGIRMEEPEVFSQTQKLVRKLLAEGVVTGLRIDHPDGLFNPPQYFTRLQMLYAASQCFGATPQLPVAENGIEIEMQSAFGQREWPRSSSPLYVVVEKILEPGEELSENWPVDGTVGYEFGNLLTNIFIEPYTRKVFTQLYTRFLGETIDIDMLIYHSKKLIMHSALSGEVNVLSHMLAEISSLDRRARDFTRKSLHDAIRETIACFPVYRTYIDERGNISERDQQYIEEAIAWARRRNGSMPAAVFDFLREILNLHGIDGGSPVHGYRKQLYFALKFQQLTGPVMAKGLEDTACYAFNRFVAVNEVGGSPKQFGVDVEEFHSANSKRLSNWPFAMLATSTHDTKRSEDVRMRLAVLSEMPRAWASHALRWRRTNKGRKRALADDRMVPDANEEYLLYQTLVGSWPLPTNIELNGSGKLPVPSFALNSENRKEFTSRIQQYMTKAVHEAKVNLSWVNTNPEYVAALQAFIARILTPGPESRRNSFLDSMLEFVPRVAFFGVMNSLAATLIKFTVPGVPDTYQGQELLDLSLVDPDNRRPVDFEKRVTLAEKLRSLDEQQLQPALLNMLQTWYDGCCKMWVTQKALRFRRDQRELMQIGEYIPLRGREGKARHVLAFARRNLKDIAVVAVPRFSFTLMNGEVKLPLGEAWGDTKLEVPPDSVNSVLRNLLTGEQVAVGTEPELLCSEIFRSFPVALLSNT